MTDELQEHGEHWCGSLIVYDPRADVHMCTGMHDDPDLVIEDCETCKEPTMPDTAARELEDAAARLLALLDDSSFRDDAFTPGAVVETLRRSGEVGALRSLIRAAYRRRTLAGAWGDDSGDDDMKDGGLGVPGYGIAVEHEEIP